MITKDLVIHWFTQNRFMKRTFILFTFCFIFSLALRAQNTGSVKGVIVDTAAKAKLVNSTVIVLNAKDSILRAFTRARADGAFQLNNLGKGNFILLITRPNYADYVEPFTLDSVHSTHDFGALNMLLKAKLLADVIIKGKKAAIKIKGDTTEFDAKAYVIQPNDKVEDLLRQLPGIEIDQNGKITAQGQTVTKVLVDGEEFFGDDPTLVTKNIRADMVDKVQLYDKKSDQATFTGIDDGKRTKTINIKLKEDKKNGEFGAVNANIGTSGYYEGQLQANKFNGSQKIAAYATAANDGRTALDYDQSSQMGEDNGGIQFVDGGIMITGNSSGDALDSFSGYYDGKGLPVAQSGGFHYNNTWDGDKQSLNTNYKIGEIQLDGVTTTETQQTLPTGTINSYGSETFNNYAFRQKLNAAYQIKLDTTSTLKISADATDRDFHVNNNYLTTTDSSGTLLNTNQRSVINHGNQQILNATAFYTKKFKKAGRTFSWNVSGSYNENQTQGYLNSEIDFYNPQGVKDSVQATNEYKTTKIVSSVLNSNMTYSEPLTKKIAVLFNYGLGINNSSADRESFDESAPGVYNIFDGTYSNDYKYNQLTNQLGAIVNYKADKAIFNFGTKVSGVNYKQVDEYNGDVLERNFINWAPQAMFQYRFSQQRSFSVNYNGTTTQPTIDQIQPVLTNTDPLNITLGNPELKPSFTNQFRMSYNDYQVLGGQSLYLNASYSNTSNAIVNNTVENEGTTTTQYLNLADKLQYTYNLYAYFGRKIDPLGGIGVGLNLSTNANVSYSYINDQLDMANSHTYSAELSISKYLQNKFQIYTTAGPNYTFSDMSLQPLANNNAAGFRANGGANFQLPLKFGAGSNINYTYTAGTQSFSPEYKTIWGAYVYKTFLKDDKLKISLSANDLLNQNINFSRNVSGSTITQTDTNGIGRFFMLSCTWDFTKFATTASKD